VAGIEVGDPEEREGARLHEIVITITRGGISGMCVCGYYILRVSE
jgi:hypothetical protein